jgi:hypothetical protein
LGVDDLHLLTLGDTHLLYDRNSQEVYGLRDGERVGVQFAKSCGTWVDVNKLHLGDDFRGWGPFAKSDHSRIAGLLKYLQERNRLRIVGGEFNN